MKLEPTPYPPNLVPQGVGELDIQLCRLIYEEHTGDNQPEALPGLHLDRFSLTSTIVSATGTANRRSLGMSLPVTLQMP